MPCEEGFARHKSKSSQGATEELFKRGCTLGCIRKNYEFREAERSRCFLYLQRHATPKLFFVELWRDDIIDLDLVAATAGGSWSPSFMNVFDSFCHLQRT